MFFFYFSLSCVLFDETQTHKKIKVQITAAQQFPFLRRPLEDGTAVEGGSSKTTKRQTQTHAILLCFNILFLIFRRPQRRNTKRQFA